MTSHYIEEQVLLARMGRALAQCSHGELSSPSFRAIFYAYAGIPAADALRLDGEAHRLELLRRAVLPGRVLPFHPTPQ
jgi:hypothetical protein